MRWIPFALVVVASTATSVHGKPSNPAFLGVAMNDIGGPPGIGPCSVSSITPNSPAQLAGLRGGDVFVSIDETPITNCNSLLLKIQQHNSGDSIDIKVRRDGNEPSLKATLLSREEVLRRRGIIGQPVLATSLLAADRQPVDLSDAKKRTTIVGWFDSRCSDCAASFSTVARWASKHATKGSPIRVLGAVGYDRESHEDALEDMKLKQRSFDIPLLYADNDTRENMTLADAERIYFMVIDHRGIVQHVAPVAPSADDADAMLDELFATAEQCSRKLK